MAKVTKRQRLDRFFRARSEAEVVSLSILLIVAIGLADHLTGFELSFSIFYLIPVALVSWYTQRRQGAAICVASALTWYAVNYTWGRPLGPLLIPFWNTAVRFGFFFITSRLVSNLRSALDLQTSLAGRDPLTSLMNSRSFDHDGALLLQLAARHRHASSVAFLDVDGFKGVNDSQGHAVGDAVLKAVAETLEGRLRESDRIGRLGGDEFAIFLPETDLDEAREVFADVHDRLVELAARQGWPIGFSIGVAVFHAPPPPLREALQRADELMYRIKAGAKNSVLTQLFPPRAPDGGE